MCPPADRRPEVLLSYLRRRLQACPAPMHGHLRPIAETSKPSCATFTENWSPKVMAKVPESLSEYCTLYDQWIMFLLQILFQQLKHMSINLNK